MKTNKLLVAAILAIAIVAPIAGFLGDTYVPQSTTSTGERLPFLHGFPTGQIASQTGLASLERANEWLNSPPLTAAALRGKVVLVDFWTYTCINWRRTLPYTRAWSEKYRDRGLVVIGVHAPEFSFEKNLNNVRWAVGDMRIDYPIPVDNDHVIWRAFNNLYWPALYFIDSQGSVRHHHFGEGGYEQSEMIIQRLLADAGVEANGSIAYRFHARDLHLVMGPAAPGLSVRFRVRIDGQPPGAAHGIDVDEQGNGTVREQRLYQLIRQTKPIADRQFEIEFLGPEVEAFAFTFG